MRKVRFKKIEELAPVVTATKWQIWDSNLYVQVNILV
jgi:hypothetical protein